MKWTYVPPKKTITLLLYQSKLFFSHFLDDEWELSNCMLIDVIPIISDPILFIKGPDSFMTCQQWISHTSLEIWNIYWWMETSHYKKLTFEEPTWRNRMSISFVCRSLAMFYSWLNLFVSANQSTFPGESIYP